MLHNQIASAEVQAMLTQLTQSSRQEKAYRLVKEREKQAAAASAYNQAYDWLEEHHIGFEYDQEQRCYVEVAAENDNQYQSMIE